jgi:hypothetical protein
LGLQGEAGIGKTYTAQSLLRQTPCTGFGLHSTAPLKRWLEVLPKPKHLDLWAERTLAKLAAGELVANAAEALGALLAKLAPVVVHLEDLHEADAERTKLVVKLASIAQRSKGVGLLITSRTELPSPIEAVRLGPLSVADTKTLLEAQAGAEVPAEASVWIATKAAGNPLFTLEYFRHLARVGNLWNDGQRWRWREPEGRMMPSTVEALLERKLRQAADTPELEAVLEARAFLGPSLPLAEMVGLAANQLMALLETLERRGVLKAGVFAHPLFGEVLVQNLHPQRRKALAQQALEVFKGQPEQACRSRTRQPHWNQLC